MLQANQNGLPLLRFEGLASLSGLTHAVTTRHGGVSQPPFDSLNLGLGADDPAAVAQNLAILKEALGISTIAFARQVHGKTVLHAKGGEAYPLGEADGLVTDRPGVGLLIKTADCQSVILAAPRHGVVANLHAGWRGQVADIASAGVKMLKDKFNLPPHEIHAAVGPSLGPCCAEFVNWRAELPPDFQPHMAGPDHFDLWAVTAMQLERAGLDPARVEFARQCTKCGQGFFSYRRDKTTGRFGSLVALS